MLKTFLLGLVLCPLSFGAGALLGMVPYFALVFHIAPGWVGALAAYGLTLAAGVATFVVISQGRLRQRDRGLLAVALWILSGYFVSCAGVSVLMGIAMKVSEVLVRSLFKCSPILLVIGLILFGAPANTARPPGSSPRQ